jgi:hypothetical protein
VQQNRAHFRASFPDLTPAERRMLGFAEVDAGAVGQIAGSTS